MNVTNALWPTQPQLDQLADGPDGPVVYVNLLKYRDRAVYADGRPCALSGREAYRLYGMAVVPLILETGGRFLFGGRLTALHVGGVDALWDEVALMQYPSRAASLKMMQSDAYKAISVHREAGLEGQLLIEALPDFLPF